MGKLARPFLYDFKRTITSAPVISLVIITVVLSGAFVPFLRGQTVQTYVQPSQVVGVDYLDNATGYNLLVYSFNQFGQPLEGVSVSVNLTGVQSPQESTISTNSSGYAHLQLPIVQGSGQGLTAISVQNGPSNYQLAQPLPPANGIPMALFGPFASVYDSADPSKVDVSVFYAGQNGTMPQGYTVYYQAFNGSLGPGFMSGNQSAMTFLGTLNSYFSIFQLPESANISAQDQVTFALFDQQGTVLTQGSFGGYAFESHSEALKQEADQIQSFATLFVGGLLGLFVPLMAILAAYSTYGKDRVSGVLDSVLARPVSRKGLATSRYASTVLAMVLAVGLTVFALDLLVFYFVGVFLSSSFLLTTAGALSVEAAALIGIIFALSRLTRSSGTLVGIGVGLWAILDFFWGLIQFITTSVLGLNYGSAGFYWVLVVSNFFNPAQFYGLLSTYSTHTFVGGAFSIGGFQLNPADYWITPYTLVGAGILWVILPLAGFLYLALKRD